MQHFQRELAGQHTDLIVIGDSSGGGSVLATGHGEGVSTDCGHIADLSRGATGQTYLDVIALLDHRTVIHHDTGIARKVPGTVVDGRRSTVLPLILQHLQQGNVSLVTVSCGLDVPVIGVVSHHGIIESLRVDGPAAPPDQDVEYEPVQRLMGSIRYLIRNLLEQTHVIVLDGDTGHGDEPALLDGRVDCPHVAGEADGWQIATVRFGVRFQHSEPAPTDDLLLLEVGDGADLGDLLPGRGILLVPLGRPSRHRHAQSVGEIAGRCLTQSAGVLAVAGNVRVKTIGKEVVSPSNAGDRRRTLP